MKPFTYGSTGTQPKYTVIHDEHDEKDEVATVVTVATVTDDEDVDDVDYYYPVKPPQLVDGSSPFVQRRKARRKTRSSMSCCGICCCITSSICGCFLVLLLMIGMTYYAMIVRGVRMVTVETPIDFPVVSVTDQELQVVSDQIDTFIQSIIHSDVDGTRPDDLIIPSRIVNGAIARSDYLRGHAQVVMKENEFIFQTSLPMDMFPGGKHRFFVSTLDSATTTMTTADSAKITTTSFDLAKKLSLDYDGPLFVMELLSYLSINTTVHDSEWVMNLLSMNVLGHEAITTPEMKETNLLQLLRDDPNFQQDPNSKVFFQFIDSIESIRMEPDQMIIRARDPTRTKYFNFADIFDDEVVEVEESNVDDDNNKHDVADVTVTAPSRNEGNRLAYFLRH